MMKNVIGLFGVCATTTWRKDFMAEYDARGIFYFNPQVEDWDPSLAAIEADHLVSDRILLFPVTADTYAIGSLAEVGFAVLSAVMGAGSRSVIVLVEKEVNDQLKAENPVLAKESNRARALVLAHLDNIIHSEVYFVETMDEMMNVSITLYEKMLKNDDEF